MSTFYEQFMASSGEPLTHYYGVKVTKPYHIVKFPESTSAIEVEAFLMGLSNTTPIREAAIVGCR